MAKSVSGTIRFKKGKDIRSMIAKLEGFEEILNQRLESAMEDVVLKVQADAAREAPVDSGNLRASIAGEVVKESEKVKGVVGSNVEYSSYVEMGTSTNAAQPYLRPAIEANSDWIVQRFEQAVDEAASAVS